MSNWKIQVHKTGSMVRVFDGDKMVKEIKASAETYNPAESKEFAAKLLDELNAKSASTMTEPEAAPAVATNEETHAVVSQEAISPAAGEGATNAPAAPVAVEPAESEAPEAEELMKINASLTKKLAIERRERAIERKARRGLAIAKQLVDESKLDNDYDAIKGKVAEIVALEDSEIDRLERKMAGVKEFESKEEALKESRRQARLARMARTAALEAEEEGEAAQADEMDRKADLHEKKAEDYSKKAEEFDADWDYEEDVKTDKKEEKAEEEKKEASVPEDLSKLSDEEIAKKAAEVETPAEEKKEEATAEEKAEEKKEAAAEDLSKLSDAEISKKAEETPAEEKKEEKAEEKAPEAEAPATPAPEAPVVTPEQKDQAMLVEMGYTAAKKAMIEDYKKLVIAHRKLAEEAESKGETEAADKEDKAADELEEKLAAIEAAVKAAACEKSEEVKPEEEKKEEKAEEEKKEEAPAAPATEDAGADDKMSSFETELSKLATEDEAEEKKEEKGEEEKKEEPEGAAKESSADAPTLKRAHDGSTVDFGINRSVQILEMNEFAADSDVTKLSELWKNSK